MSGFIAVHVGAGFHKEKYFELYKQLCKNACLIGVQVLKNGDPAWEAASVATAFLEDSCLTNAGLGSNLTWEGNVECDACLMDGESLQFGAVGAVSGVKNPILLARALFQAQSVPLSLQRVPPCLLVGDGAHKWAISHGIPVVEPESLISVKARKQLMKYKSLAESGSTAIQGGVRLDTVGAVCADGNGHVAAAASSGGILLKQPGRVGPAGIHGAACWAEGSVAVAASGSGEDLIRTSLARTAAHSLASASFTATAFNSVIKNSFLGSPYLSVTSRKLCGMIAVKCEQGRGELLVGHSTQSMGIGFMSTNSKNPKIRMSQLPLTAVQGQSIVIDGFCW